MPPELIPDDEEYASSEDSDFAPDAAPVRDDEEVSSDSELEAESVKTTKPAKRKRGTDAEEAEDAGFENSGDEAIIEKGKKRRKKKGKKGKKGNDEAVEDEGGEGGLVKTRSMRAAEKTEKKITLVDTSKATIDVDALWANMISGKPITPTPIPSTEPPAKPSQSPDPKRSTLPVTEEGKKSSRSPSIFSEGPDSMVLIKRTYKFAGKVHTEQKLVPRNSAEAKLYLASQPDPASQTQPTVADLSKPSDPFTKPKRPPKKARRSIFEPISDAVQQRKDLHFGGRPAVGVVGAVGGAGKERKLNTVEKSAMDWAGFVDKEGIKDELDAAGKAKGAYRARQEFLARVEAKKEEEGRRARGVVM
ncbi:SWR1-complex protein 5 [Venustampulla echinocandica]|uniref:SWR1-complex protein 5 n=1 Tax=Venustampulla echinocandica TaxID=2656787 RepID=A0A370TV12_9HELO|nr:SWR1-complex protein 5 [Venustampulla echinocandica]RDL39372.1 SWR1-complex protein 5 [Venustampulla echinocandica]